MKIAGLDISTSSSGLTKFTLDDNFKVIESTYNGFTSVKKNQTNLIHFYHKDRFKSTLEKMSWMIPIIVDFVSDCDFIAFEGYSMASKGRVFDIAEFTGSIKRDLYELYKNIRIYEPTTVKKFFSGHGHADKISMYDSFIASKIPYKYSIKDLPVVNKKDGTSPTSDLIDSFAVCELLYQELLLKNHIKSLKDFDKKTIEIFSNIGSNNVDLTSKDFIRKI